MTKGITKRAVIIGAGLGGLTSGAFLARDGFEVLVLEQSRSLGGYASSFRRGPFTFEVSLHAGAFGNTPGRRLLEDLGLFDRLELVRLPELYRIVTPKYDLTFPVAQPDAFTRILAREFPDERGGIRGFVTFMTGVAREVMLFSDKGQKVTPLFPIQYPGMWSTRGRTLADLLAGRIRNDECKALMSILWCYYGLPPSRLSGFFFSVGTGQYLLDGGFYPKRRSQDLSNALVDLIEKHGGEVRRGTRVERLTTRGDRVVSVEDSGGGSHRADMVVSNTSPEVTIGRLLDQRGLGWFSKAKVWRYRRRLQRYRPSLSSFVVWLGLDRDIRSELKEVEIFLSTGHDPEADYRASVAGDPRRVLVAVTAYDNVFDGYSPPGKSTLTLMFLSGYDPWRRFAEDYERGDKRAYNEEKARVARVLIERVEAELIPGLTGSIETCVVGTPLTNIRYTGNPRGAIYGYDQALNNTFYNRLSVETPLRNLFMAGAWSTPGGGFPATIRSGSMAYERIVKELGRSS
jgi:prolycopene isomerase